MQNPFYLKQMPVDGEFCNRTKEIKELADFTRSKNNVVLYGPRRYGKTSLLRRMQHQLSDEGVVAVYVDFYGVGSVDDVASRMAEAVFKVTRHKESVWKKALRAITSFRPILKPTADGNVEVSIEAASCQSGIPLLKNTMEELGRLITSSDDLVSIVLDEFQEIVTLKDCLKIEAAMRTEIQQQQASYIFAGSQRRILRNIFNEKHRPFFRSAFEYELKQLPEQELAKYICEQFQTNGIECELSYAHRMAAVTESFPYYAQKLAYFVFDRSREQKTATTESIDGGLADTIDNEKSAFEATLLAIPSQQRMFLRALAKEPTTQPFSRAYARKHNLGSLSAIQNALKQLDAQDLIHQTDNTWRIVDPVFRIWLASA